MPAPETMLPTPAPPPPLTDPLVLDWQTVAMVVLTTVLTTFVACYFLLK
jgi:hypothetical protein